MKKSLIVGITCVSSSVIGTTGYLLFKNYNKPPFRVNPNGKSLGTKYPDAKIPKQFDSTIADNSFWLGKTAKLKAYLISSSNPQETNIDHPLVQKIIDARLTGPRVHANLEKRHFSLTPRGEFLLGDPAISTILAVFCQTKKNAEYPDIAGFPDVMKNLCTED